MARSSSPPSVPEPRPPRLWWTGEALSPAELRAQARIRHERKLVGRMRLLFGDGPRDAICGDCVHFRAVSLAKKYFKCELGPQSHGPGTDWRVRWRACGKFVKRALLGR